MVGACRYMGMLATEEQLAAWQIVLESRDHGDAFERRLRRSPEFSSAIAVARDLRAFFPHRLVVLVYSAASAPDQAGAEG